MKNFKKVDNLLYTSRELQRRSPITKKTSKTWNIMFFTSWSDNTHTCTYDQHRQTNI